MTHREDRRAGRADGRVTRNDDVDWDGWPVEEYLAENYREVHPCDAAVIAHHSAVCRRIGPGRVGRAVEFGAGPNLYPLVLASAAARRVDAVEAGAANVAYLRRQLAHGPEDSWRPFHALCRELNPAVPPSLEEALARVRVVHADVRRVPPGTYGLASMNFVAEGVTEDFGEFAALCRGFVRSVVPGGRLVAAFMENMPTYRVGRATVWPGCPVRPALLVEVFGPHTRHLAVTRIAADPTLPDYGHTGMVCLSAVRAGGPG
ncbi:class I SAM-dependent methyltransferase [Streptomyces sp. HNM0574]|uniref:class I SAM-dependent methyltransferase n=1 Tax=Streptomyces sp. HNM0574 TaxID=2714954 RepID=UPI00146B1FF7|nr:class I SAM-dependent methyltransferase [Streptomyces sp. HNM0574]NLU66145.1 class I SAM-dependent methyltransferase [Streptomyces sp. HNM0574]